MYDVTATDINGCTILTSIELIEPDPINIQVDVTSNYNGQDVSCNGATDGEVTIQISGGSPIYNVSVGNNNYQITGTSVLDNLGAGAFNVIVEDLNGCETISAVVLTEPSPVLSDIVIQSNYNGLPVSCESNSDGIINVNTVGGTAPYNYIWNNDPAMNTAFLDNLGVGTYTVLVTDANGCTSSDTVTLEGNPNPVFETSNPQRICQGEEAYFNILSNDSTITNCMWTFETGETFTSCNDYSYNFNTTGCIDATVSVTSSNGCVTQLQLNDFVCVDSNPVADFSSSTTELTSIDTYVKFWNESTNASSYEWQFGDGFSSQASDPTHTFPTNETGDYNVVLYAYSEFGCVDSTLRVITVKEDIRVFVPNAFTPDGNLFNETFKPVIDGEYNPYDYTLLLFNRWGEVVFESRNADIGWDGTFNQKIVQDGVYIWKIHVSSLDGTIEKDLTGHVTLLK